MDSKERNQIRFETELEFVQALANPFYLNNLASQGFFEDDAFINYLDYLQYWRQPKYARFIQFPQCLHHLGLVQQPQFRQDIKLYHVAQQLASKQLAHWATWREPMATGAGGTISDGVTTNGITNGNIMITTTAQDVKMRAAGELQ